MNYWLMKSEPSELSIDDLERMKDKTVAWFGVRNFQARNYMMKSMKLGDFAFFYHSSCAEPGIAGIVEVVSSAYPDLTQFDDNSKYFDEKATEASPRWYNVDVRLVQKTKFVPLAQLKGVPKLQSMRVLARGNRLSITPVSQPEWEFISSNLLKQP